jgi:hypothetical protein
MELDQAPVNVPLAPAQGRSVKSRLLSMDRMRGL